MSTIKSSAEHLTLNADGTSKEVKIQRNGTQVLATTSTGIDVTGTVTAVGSMNIDHSGSDTFATLVGPSNRDLRIDLQANDDNDGLVVRDLRDNSERFVVNAGGNVGISTSTPLAPVVAKTSVTADSDKIVYGMTQSDNNAGRIVGMGIASTGSVANQGLSFYTCLSSVQSERLRIDENGNVGIGTSSPAKELDVSGEIRASSGILFGTDTAAANALDDYEEGTWTPVYNSVSAPSYTVQTGRYTKIGRIVNCSLTITCSALNTGDPSAFAIGGIPFSAQTTNEVTSASMGRYTSILGSATDGTIHFRLANTSVLLMDGDNSSLSYSAGSQSGTLTMAFTYEAD